MSLRNRKFQVLIIAVLVVLAIGFFGLIAIAGGDSKGGGKGGKSKDLTLRVIIDSLPVVAGQRFIAAEFEKETGIKIDILEVPYGELKEKVMLDIIGGSGTFDLVCPDGAWSAEIMASGYILKIDDFVKELKADSQYDFDDLVPGGLEFVVWDGSWYGIPSTLHSNAYLISRKDLLEKAGFDVPRTWEEFDEIAEYFTGYVDPETGEKVDYGTITPGERDDPIIMAWMNRMLSMGGAIDGRGIGSLWDNNFEPTFQKGPGLESAKLLMKHLIEYGPPGPTSVTWGTQIEVFMSGRAAMIAGWDVNFADIEDPSQSKVVGKTIYSQIPVLAGKKGGGLLATRPYFIPKGSKNQDAAKAYIKFATSKEQDKQIVLNGAPAPIRFSNFSDRDVLAKWPSMKEAGKIYANLINEPLVPEWSEIKEALGIALTRAAVGEIEVGDALDEAAETVREIFERAGYYK